MLFSKTKEIFSRSELQILKLMVRGLNSESIVSQYSSYPQSQKKYSEIRSFERAGTIGEADKARLGLIRFSSIYSRSTWVVWRKSDQLYFEELMRITSGKYN